MRQKAIYQDLLVGHRHKGNGSDHQSCPNTHGDETYLAVGVASPRGRLWLRSVRYHRLQSGQRIKLGQPLEQSALDLGAEAPTRDDNGVRRQGATNGSRPFVPVAFIFSGGGLATE